MERIIVIGGKGTAVNIALHVKDAAARFGARSKLFGFAVDDVTLGDEICGIPVLCRPGEIQARYPDPDTKVIFALYKPELMRERVALLRSYGLPLHKFASFVHPSSYVASSAALGQGTVVLSNCSINHAVRVGNFVIINSSVVIEHESVVQDCVFASAACCIGSKVNVGVGAFLGLNSTLREQVSVGQYGFVGMGANVLEVVPEGAKVYGNPARVH